MTTAVTSMSRPDPAAPASPINRELMEFLAKVADLVANATPAERTAARRVIERDDVAKDVQTVETLTPVIAAIIFHENNVHNRDFSLSKAQAYAHQMRLGYWKLVHQGIAFYVDKKLADAQHRLAAVVLSDTEQRFYVCRNFDHDALEAIDTAKRRTAGEAFGITGLISKEESKVAGSMVESVMKYESLRLHAKSIAPSIYEQKDWATQHLDELKTSLQIANEVHRGDPVLTKPEIGSIVLGMIVNGYDPELTKDFLTNLMQSTGYQESPTIDLYRQFLKAKESANPKGRLTKEEKMALAFKGAAIFAKRASTGGLRWKKGKEPLPAPVPPTVVASAA